MEWVSNVSIREAKSTRGWGASRGVRRNFEQLAESIGRLYTRGAGIEWTAWEEGARKTEVPKYAFQRKPYWIKEVSEAAVSNRHPLLSQHTESAKHAGEHVFETNVSLESHGFLREHQVYGMSLMPGAAFFEMALSAAQEIFSSDQPSLRGATIGQPFVINENETRILQLIATAKSDRSADFQILSRPADQTEWTSHVSGKLEAVDGGFVPADAISLEEAKDSNPDEIPVSEHYQACLNAGLAYGEKFQGATSLYKGENSALGHIQQPQSAGDLYLIHPGQLDSCLQVALTAIGSLEQGLSLPLSIERFTLLKKTNRRPLVPSASGCD